jgi:universal stress protein E
VSRNILCVVQFDRYPEIVVERATWLAHTHGCNLHLLVCDPITDFLGDSYVYLLESQDIAESIRSHQEELLAELVAGVTQAGVGVEINRSLERHVSDVIRREADSRQPMFVLKGTHYHTPTEKASLDSADWDLIRDLDYPLWFVKPTGWRDRPVVVAAVDPLNANDKPASLDYRIIDRARLVADECKGELKVLHTYQRLAEIGQRATWAVKPAKLPVKELDRKIREEHRKALAALAEASNIPAKAVYLLPGRAHEVLPAFALEHDASLVVMGALARSKLRQRIIGSTAARALDHIHCDVLIAHARPH